MSPDGSNLYTVSSDSSGAVAEFARHANGSLTQLGGANSCIEENATGQGGQPAAGCGTQTGHGLGQEQRDQGQPGRRERLRGRAHGRLRNDCRNAVAEFSRRADGSLAQLASPNDCIQEQLDEATDCGDETGHGIGSQFGQVGLAISPGADSVYTTGDLNGGDIAEFARTLPTLTVSLAGPGSGTVSDGTGAISCAPTCSHAYPIGSVVTLTASPQAGSGLAGWSGGGCTGATTCQVTMTADTAVTASFSTQSAPSPVVTGTPSVSATGAGFSGSVNPERARDDRFVPVRPGSEVHRRWSDRVHELDARADRRLRLLEPCGDGVGVGTSRERGLPRQARGHQQRRDHVRAGRYVHDQSRRDARLTDAGQDVQPRAGQRHGADQDQRRVRPAHRADPDPEEHGHRRAPRRAVADHRRYRRVAPRPRRRRRARSPSRSPRPRRARSAARCSSSPRRPAAPAKASSHSPSSRAPGSRARRPTRPARNPRRKPATPQPPRSRARPSSCSTPAPKASSRPAAATPPPPSAAPNGRSPTAATSTLAHDITDSITVADFVHHKTIILRADQANWAKKPSTESNVKRIVVKVAVTAFFVLATQAQAATFTVGTTSDATGACANPQAYTCSLRQLLDAEGAFSPGNGSRRAPIIVPAGSLVAQQRASFSSSRT